MPETGSIATKPVSKMFRELARAKRSGILRLTSARRIKAIFFENGEAVFALSNVPEDQLDVLLVRKGKITRDQARLAKSQIAKETDLGRKLVELNFLDLAAVEEAAREQIFAIVASVLQWTDGEYMLDSSARINHDVSLQMPMGRILIEAARETPTDAIRVLLGGSDRKYVVPETEEALAGASLSPTEGFLLSRLVSPVTISEAASEAGMSEHQALLAVFALLSAGFIVQVRGGSADLPEQAGVAEQSVEELRRDLAATLTSFKSADYYTVLDLDRDVDVAEIKRSYYALAKRFHPDRTQSTDAAIREILENIFAIVSKAYDTLKDSRLRADYDARLGPAAPRKPVPAPTPAPPRAAPPSPPTPQPKRPTVASSPPKPAPTSSVPRTETPYKKSDTNPPSPPTPAPRPPVAPTPAPAPPEPPPEPVRPPEAAPTTQAELAERTFREGQRRFEARDLMGAISLWRDAVRIDPNNAEYHLRLGVALCRNPRWTKEAESHLAVAVRLDPTNIEGLMTLGDLYKERNLIKRAEAQFRSIVRLSPGHPGARKALTDLGFTDLPPLPRPKGSDEATGGLLSKLFKRK